MYDETSHIYGLNSNTDDEYDVGNKAAFSHWLH